MLVFWEQLRYSIDAQAMTGEMKMDLYEILRTHTRPWSFREIVCFSIFFLIVIGITVMLRRKNRIKTSQAVFFCFMVAYLAVVFASTVFTRNPTEYASYELQPLWSWEKAFLEHSAVALEEIFLNILLLIPFGMTLPFIFNRRTKASQGLLCGFLVSVVIEIAQLVLHRGLFEWDDMLHNALGSMLGCIWMNWLICRFRLLRRKLKKTESR